MAVFEGGGSTKKTTSKPTSSSSSSSKSSTKPASGGSKAVFEAVQAAAKAAADTAAKAAEKIVAANKPKSSGGGGSGGTPSMADLAGRYGFVEAFFNSDPELKKLIEQAQKNNWTVEQFQGRFMDTKWYRSRQASVRTWADLKTRDPKEAEKKIHDRTLELKNQLSQFGISISDKEIRAMAEKSLEFAWTATEMRNVLASMVTYVPGQMGGTPAALEMQIQALANEYGIDLTDKQAMDYVQGMLTERYTEDNLRDFLRDMAKSKYAGMASFLDRGMTVREVATPYITSYAQLFEVDPDSVDLRDSLIQQALQGAPAAPGQLPQMQSLYQFERALRRDSRWLRTKNARDSLVNAGMGILKDWGLVG